LFEKSEHKCSNYGIFVRRTNGRWNIGSDASERVGAREGEGKGRHHSFAGVLACVICRAKSSSNDASVHEKEDGVVITARCSRFLLCEM
jgi:hypothetical protein